MNIDEMEWPLSKEELEYLYWDKKLIQREIGNIFNKTRGSVKYWMNKYNIKRRQVFAKKTTKKFKKEVRNLVGDGYSVLGRYKGADDKIKIIHNKCGYEYKVTPANFLAGNRCPKCASKKIGNLKRKTIKQFKKEVYNLVGNEYTFLEKYITTDDKIKVKHNKCGHIYKVTPNNFLKGKRCPKCANFGYSKGEQKIQKFLNKIKIDHKWQFSYKKCRNTNPLPFDFKIKNKPIVIEYNGKQHYEPIEYFGGKETFEYQQKNDRIKKKFCKENNIKLITIPYWNKDNIEEILEEELKELI